VADDPDQPIAIGGKPTDPDTPLSIGGKPADPDEPVAVNGRTVGEPQGFWADFGQATGGVTGLLEAPFTSSIPAEVVKGIARDPEGFAEGALSPQGIGSTVAMGPIGAVAQGIAGQLYKKIEDFLAQPNDKSLTQRMQESFGEVAKQATEHPGSLVGGLAKGIVSDPELFFLPGLGEAGAAVKGAKVAETLGAGAKTAEAVGAATGKAAAVGGAAAIGGGAEVASEYGEGRPLDPAAIGLSALIAAPAGLAQLHPTTKPPSPKLSAAEIDDMLAPAVKSGGASPKAEIIPTAEGYMVRVEGQTDNGRSFPTKAEAETAKQEIEAVGSAHTSLGTVPRGASEREELLFKNPFTAENMRKWVERPKEDVPKSASEHLKFVRDLAISGGVGAGIGAVLDRDDRSMGAEFGAGISVVPRLLSKANPVKGKRLSIEEVINARNGELAVNARRTLQFKAAIDSAVPEPLRRNAISLALEKHPGISLNPTEAKVAQSVREWFDAMGKAGVEAGVLKEMLQDYVTHIVEEAPDGKTKGLIDRLVDVLTGADRSQGQQPSGRQFSQHRRYATFDELQTALRGSGLRIKTGDIGEIMAIYSKAMFKAITDKRLVTALKAEPVEGMKPLLIPKERVSRAPGKDLEQTGGFKLPPEPGPGEAAQRFANRPADTLIKPVEQMDPNYTVLPSRQLAGYAVHKDIAPQLNFVFNARDPNDVTLGLMALNQASKRAIVSFSLFHAKSLYDAFVGAAGFKSWPTPNMAYQRAVKAVEMFKRGGSNDGIDHLLRGGLVLQVPDDIATDRLHGALAKAAAIVDQHLPVSAVGAAAKGISKFNDTLDNFTFGALQTGFKLITGLDAFERLVKKGVAPEIAGKLGASYANDIFGSLDWFRVANDVGSRIGRDAVYGFFNPNGRRWLQLLMFAPDWTFSTFRAAYKALPGAVDDAALAALHRRYLAKSAMYYLTVANGLNYLMAGHSIFDNENPTRVQLKDGRTMQWSKHSMEPFEWLKDPIQTAANKLAFIPREAMQQITGKEYISAHDAAPDIENRAAHLASQFLPIPAQQGLAGGGATSVMGLVGMPVYGKDPEQKREARLAKKKADKEKRKRAAEYHQRIAQ
jgi:hypothetical protein